MGKVIRNWIILGALSIASMAMACQCFAGAPTIVLDIPSSTATRMEPHPLHAGIDWASSDAGESDTANLGGAAWTNTTGSEYGLNASLKSLSVYKGIYHITEGAGLSNAELTEGTAGSLAAGEWDVVGGVLHIRLSDSSNPNSAAASDITVYSEYTADQMRIMWRLIGVTGSASDDIPDKYRYVTDPRPRLNSRQIDQTGDDTSNFNRPRGFNFGWIVVAGEWQIEATAINPSGYTVTATSSTITVAADSRTEYTVQAIGGDYTTIAECLADDPLTTGTVIAARDNIRITVEDGHTETITAGFTDVTGDNFYICQAGTGTRPHVSWNGNLSGGSDVIFEMQGENSVLEGFEFTELSGRIASGADEVQVTTNWDTSAVVYCHCNGSSGDYRFNNAYMGWSDVRGFLILRCSTDYTRDYSQNNQSNNDVENITLSGCTFGPSSNESTVRTVGGPVGYNVCWCSLTNDGSKSAFRLPADDHIHGYGNVFTNGDNWTGAAGPSGTGVDFVRMEANYASGDSSAAAPILGIRSNVQYATACNNIVKGPQYVQLSLGNNIDDGVTKEKEYLNFLHNTQISEDGHTGSYWTGGTTNGQTYHNDNLVQANLMSHADGNDLNGFLVIIGDDVADFVDNVFPATTSIAAFARVYVGTSIDHSDSALANFNAETWAWSNTEADVSLSADFEPQSSNPVDTAPGTYDDYFGNARESTSEAGAVDGPPALTYQTFIPGVLIRQP